MGLKVKIYFERETIMLRVIIFLNRTAHSEFHQTQSAPGAVVVVIVW